jgi:hypothetical protein
MRPEISRQRIEKYLEAHVVKCTEPALMKLTRDLIDSTPEDAKKKLKVIILFYKGFDASETSDECVELFLHNPHEAGSEVKSKINSAQIVRANDSSVVRRVTKKEYIIDNILGFVVFGFILFPIIYGVINAFF